MPITKGKLGDVLVHINEFPFDAAIYFPDLKRYEADTPCIVGWPDNSGVAVFHRNCLSYGFKNWLNVAVVSDTCDGVPEKSEATLIAAFNEDCREGGWLSRMMNYWGGRGQVIPRGDRKTPKCKPFPPASRYKRKAIRSLRYDGETLAIEIEGEGLAFARVLFQRVGGFRVLDQPDLCKLWDGFDEANGWLYEVEEGGWLEIESTRPMFNSQVILPGLREYLLVDNKCISVLSHRPPEIQDVGTDPQRES